MIVDLEARLPVHVQLVSEMEQRVVLAAGHRHTDRDLGTDRTDAQWCFDVQDVNDSDLRSDPGGLESGQRVQLFDRLSSQLNQRWNLTGDIVSSGKCLALSGDAANNGARAIACNCDDPDVQDWDHYRQECLRARRRACWRKKAQDSAEQCGRGPALDIRERRETGSWSRGAPVIAFPLSLFVRFNIGCIPRRWPARLSVCPSFRCTQHELCPPKDVSQV